MVTTENILEKKFDISDILYAFNIGKRRVTIDYLIKEMGLNSEKIYFELRASTEAFDLCMQLACDYFHVKKEDILSRCRKREFVTPRQIITYIMRMRYNMSATEIGRKLNRDHATALHSTNLVEAYLENGDRLTTEAYRFIINELDKKEEQYATAV